MLPLSPISKIGTFTAAFVSSCSLFASSPARGESEIAVDLGGVRSPFTETVRTTARDWPAAPVGPWGGLDWTIPEADQPLRVRCFHPKDSELYMGIEQLQLIHAPLETVSAIVEDINHYSKLFPGYKRTEILERTGNRLLTRWEQIVPVFFIPNVKYEMLYVTAAPGPDRRVLRYQLKSPTSLKKSDGLIVLERLGPKLTRYFELDVFDADWSIAPLFGKEKLWRESLEGLYLSDLGIQLKAEHPEWSYDRIREEEKKTLDSPRITATIQHALSQRVSWDPPSGGTSR